MVFQKTTEFLLENFPDKKVELYSDQYTKDLYEYLAKFIERESLPEAKNDIRDAFIDFFKDLGSVLVIFKGLERIVVRIRPYEKVSDSDQIVGQIVLLLEMEKEGIIKESPRDDLISIDDGILLRLNSKIEGINPHVNKKDILKSAVTKVFSLNPKDAVVYLKEKLFVRLYKVEEKSAGESKPAQAKSGGREQRFNGLPPEELEQMKKDIFPNGIDEHLKDLMPLINLNGLNFSNIRNDYFEANHIQVIQRSLKEYLSKKTTCEIFVLEGFVNFIFRESFEIIHKELAKNLLKKFVAQEGLSEMFIKYYSGDVVVFDGIKYRLPEIVDGEGSIWKAPVIKTVVKQRELNIQKQNEKRKIIKAKEKELVTHVADLKKKEDEIKLEKEVFESTQKQLDDILAELMSKRKELKAKRDEQKLAPNDKELEKSIEAFAEEIRRTASKEASMLRDRKSQEAHLNKLTNQEIGIVQTMKATKAKIVEEKGRLEKYIASVKEVEDKHNTLLDALTKALIKKKQKA